MSKHTPGPWIADTNYDGALVLADGDRCIAVCREGKIIEDQANARLIAAAPELLKALQSIVFQTAQGSVLDRDACITVARTAIAKATQT